MKMWKHIGLVLLIIAIIVLGAGAMRGSVLGLSLPPGNLANELFVVAIIFVLGLAVPYWVLKLGVHTAHLSDANEQEVEMKNIPEPQKNAIAVTAAKKASRTH